MMDTRVSKRIANKWVRDSFYGTLYDQTSHVDDLFKSIKKRKTRNSQE